MALDGITIASIIHEMKGKVLGGRIDKIYQPEKDEILINMRGVGNNHKLLMTASSSHPRLHFTQQNKDNPMQAPLFCMVLRKHLTGGKIIDITQPKFERIVQIHIESLNEMGDLSQKKLIIEIMGKHSNIILTDENDIILDSAKHISHDTSSVREVLPGKQYLLPPSKDKLNPMELEKGSFLSAIKDKKTSKILNAVFQSYNGISPFVAGEVCFQAQVDPDLHMETISDEEILKVYDAFETLVHRVKNSQYHYESIYHLDGKPMEFSCVPMTEYNEYKKNVFDSVSQLLENFYGEKDSVYRISQKTVDLRKIIQLNLERCVKKKEVYLKTLADIKDRDKLKVNGELLTANIYSVEKGMTAFTTQNYYEEDYPEITIRLDPNLTPAENAQKYFKKYNKQKRTFVALQDQIKQNDDELSYLESLLATLLTCSDEADIEEIREELAEVGLVKKRKKAKGFKPKKAKPLHYISTDGFDIYVGKNNKQNDELTLKFAENLDIWLHTKDIPGSHVIIRTGGKTAPERTLEEAANLAAFYSKGKNSSHVPVDYTIKKNVKKPNGAKPGMVIYENNKTAYITPDEDKVKEMKEC